MKRLIFITGLMGAMAIALGAFGAHGLESMVAGLPDEAKRLHWWQTAAHYHLIHVPALGLCAWLLERAGLQKAGENASRLPAKLAAAGFLVGVCIFSGTLYLMALGGPRWLGAITPLGGLSLIVGWSSVAWSSTKLKIELS